MIDHAFVAVTDFERGIAFYERVLGTLGYQLLAVHSAAAGYRTDAAAFGDANGIDLWLYRVTPPSPTMHIGFAALSREAVDNFYTEGLAAGGRIDETADKDATVHAGAYSSAVLDPDGNRIQAICRSQ